MLRGFGRVVGAVALALAVMVAGLPADAHGGGSGKSGRLACLSQSFGFPGHARCIGHRTMQMALTMRNANRIA